ARSATVAAIPVDDQRPPTDRLNDLDASLKLSDRRITDLERRPDLTSELEEIGHRIDTLEERPDLTSDVQRLGGRLNLVERRRRWPFGIVLGVVGALGILALVIALAANGK